MTLEEFSNIVYTSPHKALNKIIVFDDEESMDSWVSDYYKETEQEARDWEVLATIYTNYKLGVTFNERLCKAEVQQVVAVDRDVLAVTVTWGT